MTTAISERPAAALAEPDAADRRRRRSTGSARSGSPASDPGATVIVGPAGRP